jgi:prepilin-type N-terminal cleavage/methylation domain-containing protein
MMKKDGFTIIELLITMIILGIVTSIAIPVFSTWLPDYRLRSAAREVYSNMQLTKMSAVRNNADWAIFFDTALNRYLVCSDAGADGNWATPADNTNEKVINLSDYGDSIRYGHGSAAFAIGGSFGGDHVTFGVSGNNVAVFNTRGLLNPPSGYVYLTNSKRNAFSIGGLTSGVTVLRKWNGAGWE